MKSYPTIPKFKSDSIKLHTFDKLDGSNLRFEWTRKKGWYKFGTRTRLFDETDQQFKEAIPLFHNTLAKPLECIIKNNRWDRVIIFTEFWGKESFAGVHIKEDPKFLTVIEANIHPHGFLPPKEFLKFFEEFGPNYLGYINWGPEFVEQVRLNKIEGITFEGVVGKAKERNQMVFYKIKTQQWIDKVRAFYKQEEAQKIIES